MELRFLGAYSFESYARRIILAGQACGDRKAKLLLVDIRELKEFTPTTTDRYELGRTGAKASPPGAKVAMLVTPAQFRDTFGATVARNFGLAIQAFMDREQALQWLLATRGGPEAP